MNIVEFFETYQSVIYPTAIAISAVAYNIVKIMRKRWTAMKQADTEANRIKNQQKFSDWEHLESMSIISRIQKSCNFYKDKSKADRVAYFQLENGTVASSKLCNMFITCLCEDNRYSVLPKEILKLRRIPYSQLSLWVESLSEVVADLSRPKYLHLHGECEKLKSINDLNTDKIGTQLVAPIMDYNNTFVGAVLFDYKFPITDENSLNAEISNVLELRAVVYNCMMTYHELRKEQMRLLNIKEVLHHGGNI
jgi:hypothetical protein